MTPLDAATWSLIGAATVEAYEVLKAITSEKQPQRPWVRSEIKINLLAVALRLIIAASLGAGMSEQFNGRLAAYVVGIGAPVILAGILLDFQSRKRSFVEPTAEEAQS